MFAIVPYKLDHRLARQPWVTYAIALLCLGIYYWQAANEEHIQEATGQFCAQDHGMNFAALTRQLEQNYDYLDSPAAVCEELMWIIHNEKDTAGMIESLAKEEVADFENPAMTLERLELTMSMAYSDFKTMAPMNLTRFLSYRAGSFNPFSSFLSAFAHADWWHVIGNLLFFLAFAGAVELFIASTGKYLLSLFTIEVGLDFTWSVANWATPEAVTLGLSGIVSGMIGFMAYAVPWGHIRCLFYFVVYFWRAAIPIWLLALWFVGWDVYYLMSTDASSVNYLAHVVGAGLGYGVAWLFFRQRKTELAEDIQQELTRRRMEQVHQVGRGW